MGQMATRSRAPSQRDRRLPHAFEAWVDALQGRGREPVWDHYFSPTVCGLIECLQDEGIAPRNVRLFGLYRHGQVPLDLASLVRDDGNWLERPELCRELERRFADGHDECWRGHTARGVCAFADRERTGAGPTW